MRSRLLRLLIRREIIRSGANSFIAPANGEGALAFPLLLKRRTEAAVAVARPNETNILLRRNALKSSSPQLE
ncbi:hypothetical protein [Bacillus xiapuensis]|uniref:hypothetical protein n=1 Tax=Bacillus xiapuensis TaxID=2014075 RepID=UPI000C246B55|nr:hypothetical protein [Bacillus xiapuensis]